MAKVRLSLDELNPLEKAALAERVAAGTTDNANIPTPVVEPAALISAASTLRTAENAVRAAEDRVTTLVGERDAASESLDALLREAAKDVEKKTLGDAAKIASANLSSREDNEPVGALPAPGGLTLSTGDDDGELDAQWEPVRGRQFFELALKEEGTTEWVTKVTDTKSRATVSGLISGKRYRARVRAKGAAGYSPWSDEAGPRTAP